MKSSTQMADAPNSDVGSRFCTWGPVARQMADAPNSDVGSRFCTWGPVARQVCSVLVVSSSMLHVGLFVGWATVLPAMQADNSTFTITDYDVRWLVSSLGIVGMFTNLPTAPLIAFVGYRRLLTVCLLPVSASWFMQALAPSKVILYVGRIIGGIGFMVINIIVPPLMTELLEPTYRGLLVCGAELIISVGILLAYLMASFLQWKLVTILSGLPLIPIFLLSLAVPESPFWLVRAGRMREAELALKKLRGPTRKLEAKEELMQIQKSIREQPQTSFHEQVRQIANSQNFQPLLLVSSMMILRELGGQFAIFSYAVYFFSKAGVVLDPFTCTVLVGVMRLGSTIICALLIDRIGRRIILTVGCSCCAISIAVGSIFLIWRIPGSSWVPIVAVLAFVLGYGFGVGPIPWVLVGELLPTPIRVVGSSIVSFTFATIQVFVGFMYPKLVDGVGLGYSFLIFAAFNTFLTIVVCVFLPETTAKSLHTLEHAFSNPKDTFTELIPIETETNPVDIRAEPQDPLL